MTEAKQPPLRGPAKGAGPQGGGFAVLGAYPAGQKRRRDFLSAANGQ